MAFYIFVIFIVLFDHFFKKEALETSFIFVYKPLILNAEYNYLYL